MGHNRKTKSREQRVTDNRHALRKHARELRDHDRRIEAVADDATVARLRLEARMIRDIEELAIQLALLQRPWYVKLRDRIRTFWSSEDREIRALEKESEKLSVPISPKRELDRDPVRRFGDGPRELGIELDDQDEKTKLVMIGEDGQETEIEPIEGPVFLGMDLARPESDRTTVQEFEDHFDPAPALRAKGKAV